MFPYRWLILPLTLITTTAAADDEATRHEAVKDLGRLNGVALNCGYPAQVSAMKAAVVANAPKQRSYGLAFDEATNESFLAQIREQRPCPGEAGLAEQVDAAAARLREVFGQP